MFRLAMPSNVGSLKVQRLHEARLTFPNRLVANILTALWVIGRDDKLVEVGLCVAETCVIYVVVGLRYPHQAAAGKVGKAGALRESCKYEDGLDGGASLCFAQDQCSE